MKRSKNAGFTLIELAIVLVVIGLIIAAVLKGEDLIQNARMLNFVTNPVQKAQVGAMAYYDRTGQFPSATTSGTTTNGALYQMYQTGIDGVLDINNPFIKGSDQLGIALTTITDTQGAKATYPAIVIVPVSVSTTGYTGSTSWTTSAIGYANYLKARIDGNNDWTTGSVRFITSITTVPTFKTLQSEIGSSTPKTSAYDGYYATAQSAALTGTNAANTFATPSTSKSGVLVFFYNQQPH
ncbi:MAG: type II secretion system protein [Desulfurella sp.]|uniref:type II secretion system protein n=1 Tax=Desulfurella sp. TaxID=1962857 RepID=UPI003D0A2283